MGDEFVVCMVSVGVPLSPCSRVIAASVLFFPLLPLSGLRSRQKCMSQRYMVPAMVAGSGGWAGGGAWCTASGMLSSRGPCMFGSHRQGPGQLSCLPVPISLYPQPRPVRVGQSRQEEAAGGESPWTDRL